MSKNTSNVDHKQRRQPQQQQRDQQHLQQEPELQQQQPFSPISALLHSPTSFPHTILTGFQSPPAPTKQTLGSAPRSAYTSMSLSPSSLEKALFNEVAAELGNGNSMGAWNLLGSPTQCAGGAGFAEGRQAGKGFFCACLAA